MNDRIGNAFSTDVPYARGALIRSTADDLKKLSVAWNLMRSRIEVEGPLGIYILNGLERQMTFVAADDVPLLDDELAPAVYAHRLYEEGMKHLGGQKGRHDVMVANRLTAAIFCAGDVLIKPHNTVVGVSPRYSHPAVTRAVRHGRGAFHDCAGLEVFRSKMDELANVDVVFLTRMSVSYEILTERDLREAARVAKSRNALLIVDDAGGARAGPALLNQPHALDIGADLVCTGLDKYGVQGPRIGLACGAIDIISRMRARAFEIGCEARPMLYPVIVKSLMEYRPQRVRDMVAATMQLKEELVKRLGQERVWVTPVVAQLRGEDILDLAMQRAGIKDPPCVPYEATAGVAMILLRDYGVLTVHFAGMPPGTSALMFKFLDPETLSRFGGATRLAKAIDDSITVLSTVVANPTEYKKLLGVAGD